MNVLVALRRMCGKKSVSGCLLTGAVLLIALMRLALSAPLPPFFFGSPWDDLWFVRAAESVLMGNWLGAYDQHTLIKGCVGPVFLALAHGLGLSYLTVTTVLYLAASLFFSVIVARTVRCRWVVPAVFCYLAFNPQSFGAWTWQRIYRNGLTLWQLPLIVGILFQCYRHRFDRLRVLAAWLGLLGVLLWMFFNTREDGLWIWPVVLCCLGLAFYQRVRHGIRRPFAAVGCAFALPVLLVIAGNGLIGAVNKSVYGVFIRNDRDAGNYARAIRDLYQVRPDADDEARLSKPACREHYHNIYRSTVRRAFEVSPTLAGARREIEAAIEWWTGIGGLPDEEPWGDQMLFALRDGAAAAGCYRSLSRSEAFWGAVHEELSRAFSDGRLERRGLALTAMAAPFQMKFLPRFLEELAYAMAMSAGMQEIGVSIAPGRISPEDRPLFVRMAGRADPKEGQWREYRPHQKRAEVVISIYQVASWGLVAVAFAVYLRWSARVFAQRKAEPSWLLATGMLGGWLLNVACISYVFASTFSGTRSCYLLSAYMCLMFFVCVVMARSFEFLSAGRGHRKRGILI